MSKEEAKQEINRILLAVISGEKLWVDGYLQWGLLEKALYAVIDAISTDSEPTTKKIYDQVVERSK